MHRSLPARLGLVCSVAASLAASTAAVQAQEGVAFKNMLGNIGLLPPVKDPIPYRERAPLVLPRSADQLPVPRDGEGYAAARPDWPRDPDVAARKRKRDEERRPVTWSEARRNNDTGGLLLSNQEIARGRVAAGSGDNGPNPNHRNENARDVVVVNPDTLRARPEAREAAAGPEPVRKVLTDPPTGMRRSSSGREVQRDFAVRVDEQQRDANPMNWLTRKLKGQSDDDE